MQHVVNTIHSILIENRKTVAVAESCTGGLISKLLTDFPGSSTYFILGVVVYSNQAKTDLLKVSARLLREKGAVSKDTAIAMADSVRLLAKADFGIGVTGIAGPSGATADKPKGTCFIAAADKKRTICKRFIIKGNRLQVRSKAALKGLELLKSIL